MPAKEFNWSDATSLQWIQEALLEQRHSLVRQTMWEQDLLEQNQKRQQATGFHARAIGEKGRELQRGTGLSGTFGMGNMKGASEGMELAPHLVCGVVVLDPKLNPYAY